MNPGDLEIHTQKKIESFKYSYLHTVKVKSRKKVRGCKSRLPKQGLKQSTRSPRKTPNPIPVAKAVYQNKD